MVERRVKEFVKGKTVEEKFNSINATLKHFSRRLMSVVVGVVPSSPVYNFVFVPASDGVILRTIFPVAGKIVKSAIFVANKETKGPTRFVATIDGEDESTSRTFEVKAKPLIFDLDTPIGAGDRLTLRVEDPESVRGIWYAFLYEAELRSMTKKTFVIDQLEKIIEEDLKGATNKKG